MNDESIVLNYSNFLFPFQFDFKEIKIEEVEIATRKNSFKAFSRTDQKSLNLRHGLSEMMMRAEGDDLDNTLFTSKNADCYELNNSVRLAFGLPTKESSPLSFVPRGVTAKLSLPEGQKGFKVAINNIKVFLFESGIGLIDIECSYKSNSIEDYINCNYFISEIKSEENYFILTRGQNEEIVASYTVAELVQRIADAIAGIAPKKEKPDEETTDEEIHTDKFDFFLEKAIVYSYVLTDKEPKNIRDLLFHLRKNYKGSYKYPPDEEKCPFIIRQFENSYWTTSYNAAINLSYLTGTADTDNFFTYHFGQKLSSTYFTLFLHILHQRFALIKLIAEIGKLDLFSKNYKNMKRQLKQAQRCREEIDRLKFRNFFNLPSFVQHINDYYRLLYRTFAIGELYRSFDNDLNTLNQICDTYVARIKKRDDKIAERRKAKAEIFVSVLGTLVSVFTLFDSYWSLMDKLFGKELSFFSPQLLLFALSLLVPIVTIAVNVGFRIKDIKKLTNELNEEVADGLVEDDKQRLKK